MEQNNYGGENYQINANTIGQIGDIILPDSQPSGEEYLSNGIQLLEQQAYSQAVDVLQNAIQRDRSQSDAFYYLAIALLGGKKPRKLDKWTIQDIEINLNSAISEVASGNSKSAKYYTLFAIVKYGYYSMNGFIETPPTSDLLFSKGESIRSEFAKEILYHLNDPENPYWVRLQSKVAD